jgi:hypothetical protein
LKVESLGYKFMRRRSLESMFHVLFSSDPRWRWVLDPHLCH